GVTLSSRDRAVLLLLWAAVPQLLPFAISQVSVPVYITRGTICTAPVLVLLAAAFLDRAKAPVRWVLVAIVVTGSLAAQAAYFRAPAKEQWREVAAAVDARARPGDLAVFDAGYGRRGFDHYSHAAGLTKVNVDADLVSPAGAADLERLRLSGAPRIW